MLRRIAIPVMIIGLSSLGLPHSSTATRTIENASAQNSGLQVTTTQVSRPGDGVAWNLSGRYQNATGVLNLRATSIRGLKPIMKIAPGSGASTPNAAPGEEPYPGADAYYSNGEMSRSDGSIVAEAIYEFQDQSGRNMVYINLHGVTLTFDLNTEEIGPVSDEDLDQLSAWLATDEGRLVQQAAIALVQQGQQEPTNEALLTYYIISLLVDNDSPSQAATKMVRERQEALHSHHARVTRLPLSAPPPRGCSNAIALPSRNDLMELFALRPKPAQCFGCCGPGCVCIFTRGGQAIYGDACTAHDYCVSQNGNRRFARACLGHIPRAIGYVIFRWAF